MPPASPTARLEARISAELHATLKRAAELQDRTVTDFVIATSWLAMTVLASSEVIHLS